MCDVATKNSKDGWQRFLFGTSIISTKTNVILTKHYISVKDKDSIEDNPGHDTVVLNQIKILFLIFRFLLLILYYNVFLFSVERRKWFCDHCVGVVWRVISLIPLCESDKKNQDEQVTSRLNSRSRRWRTESSNVWPSVEETNYVHLNKKKVNLFSGNRHICFQHLTKWNWGYFLWFWFKSLSNNSIAASLNN